MHEEDGGRGGRLRLKREEIEGGTGEEGGS